MRVFALVLMTVGLIAMGGCNPKGGGSSGGGSPYVPGPFDGIWRTSCMPDGYGNSWAYEIRVANEENASVGYYKYAGEYCQTNQEIFSRLTTLQTRYGRKLSEGTEVDKIVSQEWVRPKTVALRQEFVDNQVCGLQNAWLDERGIDVAGRDCDQSWTLVVPGADNDVQQDLWKVDNGHMLIVGDLFVETPNARPTSVSSVIFYKQ